jgi:hypothetical protein
LSVSFRFAEQVPWLNAERRGETKDVFQAYVSLAAFDAAHVRAMYAGPGCKGFLAQASLLS